MRNIGWIVVLLLLASAIVASPSLALASSAAAASPEGGAAKAAEPHGTSYWLDLAIWTVVVFLLLLFVLTKFAWKPMLTGLQKREETIRSALEEAQAARDEAKTARLDLQKQLADAHSQVRAILDEGRRDAQQLRDSEMAKTAADIQTERNRLTREIEIQTDQALQKIWSQAAELATAVSAKALGRGISDDGHRKLIDEALSEIRAVGGRANGHA